jgi:hypothetical protein
MMSNALIDASVVHIISYTIIIQSSHLVGLPSHQRHDSRAIFFRAFYLSNDGNPNEVEVVGQYVYIAVI